MLLTTALAAQAATPKPERLATAVAAIAKLEAAATTEATSENAAARSAARRELGAGLKDDDWDVRARSVELLAKAKDQEAAVELLVAAVARADADLQAQLQNQKTPKAPDSDGTVGEFLEATAKLLAAAKRFDRLVGGYSNLLDTYYREFTAMPEAPRRRGYLALRQGANGFKPEWLPSLLAVCDGDVLVAVGEIGAGYVGSVKTAKDDLTKARASKPGRNPWGAKRREAWLSRENTRLAGLVDTATARLERANQDLTGFETAIGAFAQERALPAPPASSRTESSWRAWAIQARTRLQGEVAK